ncbi:uncharacterized protein LOC124262505 [Haliotis rubra]|uniref:uncharacterized protein LOC124262505 n=1 Tax=Haliotis rubra TaxID=36100 RepID=UPI001EE6005A|nr:uncharacterized protein LOC124262505 [Haliotis rubra]
MCLVLCHVLHGHQLYIHPVHIAVIIFSLLGCVAVTVAVEMMWQSEWTLVLLSQFPSLYLPGYWDQLCGPSYTCPANWIKLCEPAYAHPANGIMLCEPAYACLANGIKLCEPAYTCPANGIMLCEPAYACLANGIKLCETAYTCPANGIKLCEPAYTCPANGISSVNQPILARLMGSCSVNQPILAQLMGSCSVNQPILARLMGSSSVNQRMLTQLMGSCSVNQPMLARLMGSSSVNQPILAQLMGSSSVNQPILARLMGSCSVNQPIPARLMGSSSLHYSTACEQSPLFCVAVTVLHVNSLPCSVLQITGPFLQIGAVVLMTLMTWIISLQWFKLSHWALKLLWLTVYVAVMIGLYISPYFINSPCVAHADDLPSKPLILAHRGASEILPENTLMAYDFAYQDGVYGVESDVQLSLDCVPFILHDKSLERTTNIKEVFPDRVNDDPSSFNMSDLKRLDAGLWFLQNDPFWTSGDLTDAQRRHVANQTLPTLEELARLGRNYSDSVLMFDLLAPPHSHPCYNLSVNYTIHALTQAGFPLQNVLWLQFQNSRPTGVTFIGDRYIPVNDLRKDNMSMVNVQYTELTDSQIE